LAVLHQSAGAGVSPQQISAWIRPLIPLAYDESEAVLRLSAPNRFKLDWVRKNFSSQIEKIASQWFKKTVQVQFELPVTVSSARTNASTSKIIKQTESTPSEQAGKIVEDDAAKLSIETSTTTQKNRQ